VEVVEVEAGMIGGRQWRRRCALDIVCGWLAGSRVRERSTTDSSSNQDLASDETRVGRHPVLIQPNHDASGVFSAFPEALAGRTPGADALAHNRKV